ncbi:hypothetical protein [Brunnivagina elsteri]|uniref:Uncharacterized protein n=1 Tax=Brunnivagina elsteri CCALA 953 TaxID=987040 RepID=A0A2A2TN50_9CYAN|nr:hypothetical protein [Calothrix elsteri]PAX59862.1 hypothetical protein CK510_04750 [Calothrix elsteri CCALA 953]
MNYESKRLTISYPAIERLAQAYGLPQDLPSQTLAGYIERLIFECLCKQTVSPSTVNQGVNTSPSVTQSKPNLSKLASMAGNQK